MFLLSTVLRRRSETIASQGRATQFLADRYSALKFAQGDSRGGAFAEIRRALPSSYRESRKAVSTVVFGPAVSLERSTPLMRPRHDSHAENKNISPPRRSRAPSFSLLSESGDPALRGPVRADRVYLPTYACPMDGTSWISVFYVGACGRPRVLPAVVLPRRENFRVCNNVASCR